MLGRDAGDEDKRSGQEWFQGWNSQRAGRTKRADEVKEETERRKQEAERETNKRPQKSA